MYDHISRVDQHPVAERHSFDLCIADAMLLQLLQKPVCDCTDMALGTPRSDDHEIAKRRLARHVDADDIVSLGVIERIGDEVSERGRSRSGAYCAARSELAELLFQRVKPQREDPSLG